MLFRVLVAIACSGVRSAMDITKVGVTGSLQILAILRALTLQMSTFSPLAGFPFRCFGSLNIILVSVQSMLGLLSRTAPGCVTRHTRHASVTHFRPISGNIVEVTLVT